MEYGFIKTSFLVRFDKVHSTDLSRSGWPMKSVSVSTSSFIFSFLSSLKVFSFEAFLSQVIRIQEFCNRRAKFDFFFNGTYRSIGQLEKPRNKMQNIREANGGATVKADSEQWRKVAN